MAIFGKKREDETVNPVEQLTNLEMMNILEEVSTRRLNLLAQTYGKDNEIFKETLNLFTVSFFLVDPHLSMDDVEIKKMWENMFERSRYSRQFLIGVHSHFVTLVTQANYNKLIREKAKSYFVFKPDTFFNENNVVLDNEEDFITYLELYPWFATFLLLGDVLASSTGEEDGNQ